MRRIWLPAAAVALTSLVVAFAAPALTAWPGPASSAPQLVRAISYRYSTCDFTPPSIPWIFGFDDSIT